MFSRPPVQWDHTLRHRLVEAKQGKSLDFGEHEHPTEIKAFPVSAAQGLPFAPHPLKAGCAPHDTIEMALDSGLPTALDLVDQPLSPRNFPLGIYRTVTSFFLLVSTYISQCSFLVSSS